MLQCCCATNTKGAMLSFRWHTQTQAQTGNATHTWVRVCAGQLSETTKRTDKQQQHSYKYEKRLACQNKRIDTKREVDRSPPSFVCMCVCVYVCLCVCVLFNVSWIYCAVSLLSLSLPPLLLLLPPPPRIKCTQTSSLPSIPVWVWVCPCCMPLVSVSLDFVWSWTLQKAHTCLYADVCLCVRFPAPNLIFTIFSMKKTSPVWHYYAATATCNLRPVASDSGYISSPHHFRGTQTCSQYIADNKYPVAIIKTFSNKMKCKVLRLINNLIKD